MEITFPIFVLAKDCGDVLRLSSEDEVNHKPEAIDVENNEYEAWNSNNYELKLVVIGLTEWKAGKIGVRATGRPRT